MADEAPIGRPKIFRQSDPFRRIAIAYQVGPNDESDRRIACEYVASCADIDSAMTRCNDLMCAADKTGGQIVAFSIDRVGQVIKRREIRCPAPVNR